MSKKKLCERIDYLKYLTMGLSIGLIIAYILDINFINGICIGLSLGVLLQKLVQEKKLILTIYILTGLLVGGTLGYIFVETMYLTTFGMSAGMLIATIIYLVNPYTKKMLDVKKINELSLIVNVLLGILIGGVVGYLILDLLGIGIGIGLGMIAGIVIYIYNNRQTKKETKIVKKPKKKVKAK